MMIRLLLGVLVAGSAMFGWGYLWWDVLPKQLAAKYVPDDKAIANAGFPSQEQPGAVAAEPTTPDEPKVRQASLVRGFGDGEVTYKTMAFGYVHLLLSALFLGAILKLASPSLGGYFSRLGFVFVVGVFATLLVGSSLVIWWDQSMDFAVYHGLYYVTAAIIAGLFLAAFISHQPKVAKLPVQMR